MEKAKYLGQYINNKGEAVTIINYNALGPMIDKLKNNNLSQTSKIMLFKTYCKSKINHLLPLIIISKNIREAWESIRKVIFNVILERNTLPIELRNSLGLGFYNIMVKPILSIMENVYYSKFENNEERMYLHQIGIKAIEKMLEYEDDIGIIEKSEIIEYTKNDRIPSIKDLENILKRAYIKRIMKDDSNLNEALKTPLDLKLPLVIQYISNSVGHILDQLIDKLRLKKNVTETSRQIQNYTQKIWLITNYLSKYPDTNYNLQASKYSLDEEISYAKIKNAIIINRSLNILGRGEQVKEIIQRVISSTTDNNERIKNREVRNMIYLLRQVVANSSKQPLRDCEEILAINMLQEDEYNDEKDEKKKAGRKKLEHNVKTENIEKMLQIMKEKKY